MKTTKYVGAVLAGDDAVALHLFRQSRLRDRDAVLHQHLRLVEIGAELEGDRDGEIAVRGRLAVEIQHVLDAVDLLLDRGSNRIGNRLRGGAGILRGDDDGRRHHLRIFRNRQRGVGDCADNQQHDRQHHRQNGLVDGKPAEVHDLPPAGAVCCVTSTPTRSRWMPSTRTRSSALSPARITRRPSSSGPSVTGFASTVLSSLTTNTVFRDWSVAIAISGNNKASSGALPNSRTRPHCPGRTGEAQLRLKAALRQVPAEPANRE